MPPIGEPDTVEQSLVSLIMYALSGPKKNSVIQALESWRTLRSKLQRFTILSPTERTELYSDMTSLLETLDALKKEIGKTSKSSPALFHLDKALIGIRTTYTTIQESYVD